MKNLLFTFLLLFSFQVFSNAQTCTTKRADFPSIRGLKLGLKIEEVKKIYPEMVFVVRDSTQLGFIKKDSISNSEYQKNIDSILIIITENEVSSILIAYDNSIKWSSGYEFAEKIKESLDLPNGWRVLDEKVKKLDCSDFLMTAGFDKSDKPTLMISKPLSELGKSVNKNKETFKP